MKILKTLSLLLLTISIISCTKELTFSEKYQGDWTMTTTGAVVGSYDISIGSDPAQYTITPYRIGGDAIMNIEFESTLDIEEDGSFTIKLSSNVLTHRGTFQGTLDEMGSGNGTYNIVAWLIDEFTELPLEGNFTMIKN